MDGRTAEGTLIDQDIRFCTTNDGVKIAYSTVGQGPALVCPPGWVSNLDNIWKDQYARTFYEKLARHHTVVRYDKHGTGLSDLNRTDFSLESEIRDLETVVDHLGLEHFALFALSEGGPVSVTYTIRHPKRVSHLILYDTFADGNAIASDSYKKTLLSAVRSDWGIGSHTLAYLFIDPKDPSAYEWFTSFQRDSATPEMAAQLLELIYRINVTNLLPKLLVPTLVIHRGDDRAVPFKLGKALAAEIPGARFVPLEGNIHAPWLGDADSVLRAVAEFLGDPVDATLAAPTEQLTVHDPAKSREAISLIDKLEEVSLSRFCVVGSYVRYDEVVRNALKDVRQKIMAEYRDLSRKRKNYLIWAPSGSGKTYFVQQLAESLPSVRYCEFNLAKHGEQEFLAGLSELDKSNDLYLWLVDEIDAKPTEDWPYDTLVPYLDLSADKGKPFVFVLAGSSGSSIGEMKGRINLRHKGTDVLSRIPSENEHEIPPMGIGDRILVVLSQFRQAGKDAGREIREVEKLGLYYVSLNSSLANARQLREFAVRAIERVPHGENRVKYDNLFGVGDPENKTFWAQARPVAKNLENRFVILKD